MPEIDSVTLRMNEFEVHALRGLATAMVLLAQVHARRHPDPACIALAERLVYLKDEHYRTQLEELRAQVARDPP
jgi:hypothetical protein